MKQSEKTPSRNIIPALAILGLGIFGYLGRENIAIVVVTGLGEIALGISWLIRVGYYLSKRLRKTIYPEPMKRIIIRWSLEPAALLTIVLFPPLLFLAQFALSYPSLGPYLRGAQARAQAAFSNHAHAEPDFYRHIIGEGQWYEDNAPDKAAGWFVVKQTVVSKNGDTLMMTSVGSEFGKDEGIYYTMKRNFIPYGRIVEPVGSFQIGRRDKFTHIFGPWYYWEN